MRAKVTIAIRFLVILLSCVIAQDDYYYEYDDEASDSDAGQYENNFDLEALVSAWRDYVKDKKSSSRKSTPRTTTTAPLVSSTKSYESCAPAEESYTIPDEEQCDKFYNCNIKGELKEKLCPDGLMFDIKSGRCDYPAKVVCAKRLKLQPAKKSKNCPRANGFFPWPSELSCQKFWDCRGGKGYLQTCPEGVIFDPKIDACVTPDQAARKECTGGKFFGFQCPHYDPEQVLRFGNHDRLPNPDNCQQFYSCLRDGSPRLGACPRNTVFNNATGHCGDPPDVPGCESFWSSKNDTEYDYYY